MPEQALGGIPLGFGIAVEAKFLCKETRRGREGDFAEVCSFLDVRI